jgi:hypothetical protein
MASLGFAAQDAGSYPLANTALTEIKLRGPEDQDVAGSLNNRALLYNDQGRCAEAEPLYKRALAAIGSGAVFSNGRDFGAWLGLVPRQISTGDRTILGKVSKQGNRYLRVLFVQAAWVVLIKPQTWERYGLKQWITAAKRRLHPNVLAIALANKLARIAWAVLSNDCDFKCEKTDEMPRCA